MGVSAQLSEGVCASVGNSCALIHYIICKVVKFVFINTSFFLSFLFAPSFIIPPWVCHSFTFASPSFHTFHWNTSFCLFSLLLALFSIHLPHSPAVPRPLCALLCPLLSLLTIFFSLNPSLSISLFFLFLHLLYISFSVFYPSLPTPSLFRHHASHLVSLLCWTPTPIFLSHPHLLLCDPWLCFFFLYSIISSFPFSSSFFLNWWPFFFTYFFPLFLHSSLTLPAFLSVSLRPTDVFTPQTTSCCWRSMKTCSRPPFRPSSLGELPHFKRKWIILWNEWRHVRQWQTVTHAHTHHRNFQRLTHKHTHTICRHLWTSRRQIKETHMHFY